MNSAGPPPGLHVRRVMTRTRRRGDTARAEMAAQAFREARHVLRAAIGRSTDSAWAELVLDLDRDP